MLWLRAYARKMRWEEEVKYLLLEMESTVRGYAKKSQDWLSWRDDTEGTGHKAYAARQAAMWASLRAHAASTFAKEGVILSLWLYI